jgi:hypothetical protein
MFEAVITDYYRAYGVGVFSFNRAFRIRSAAGRGRGVPAPSTMWTASCCSDLVGYELQKRQLRDNTEAFLAGLPGQQRPALRRQRHRQILQREGAHQRVL